MGEEIGNHAFSSADWTEFENRLETETHHFYRQLADGYFSQHVPVAGFEIEAWLIDEQCLPAPVNDAFLERFDNPLATPELATFNIELNNTPVNLRGDAFTQLHQEMKQLLRSARKTANEVDAHLLMTGILPTATADYFGDEYMSHMNRYKVLNDQVFKARHGRPIHFTIEGHEHLELDYNSVMLEAATTSFQLHLQTPWHQAHHYYNASLLASAICVAISSNSPFFFGHSLWDETRITIFEQAVNPGRQYRQRVTFGSDYAHESIAECFKENLLHYPALLPVVFDRPTERYKHLRLHNGVIWRWNRPLIGFDDDGTPHIRIEHRTMPSGPSLTDMMANAVFYYGLTQNLMEQLEEGLTLPDFAITKANFYDAARLGLDTEINWFGNQVSIQSLIEKSLLAAAQSGLQSLDIDANDIESYLDVIANRNANKQTGAHWQRQHLEKVGHDMQQLTKDYLEHQRSGQAVHTWTL